MSTPGDYASLIHAINQNSVVTGAMIDLLGAQSNAINTICSELRVPISLPNCISSDKAKVLSASDDEKIKDSIMWLRRRISMGMRNRESIDTIMTDEALSELCDLSGMTSKIQARAETIRALRMDLQDMLESITLRSESIRDVLSENESVQEILSFDGGKMSSAIDDVMDRIHEVDVDLFEKSDKIKSDIQQSVTHIGSMVKPLMSRMDSLERAVRELGLVSNINFDESMASSITDSLRSGKRRK